jgi:hypothetical protein
VVMVDVPSGSRRGRKSGLGREERGLNKRRTRSREAGGVWQ